MNLVERIKTIAYKRSMTIKDLSIKAGIGPKTISNWRDRNPQTETLQKVADVLGVSVDYLLGNTDDMHANKKANTSSDDLKEYFDEHPVLKFDGKEIPEAEMKIIKRILEDMDD